MMSISFITINQLIALIKIYQICLAMTVQQYLFELGGIQWDWIKIAAFFLALPVIKLLNLLITTFIRQMLPMPELLKKYCPKQENSWAVVTGATDGIGLGFCEVLTTLGFNIVLISRNPDKLKKTVQHLESIRPAQYSTSKLKAITFNFKDSSDPQKWKALIASLQGIDIGLLVNNVGTSDMNYLSKFSNEQISEIINVNCVSMAALTSEVIKIMERRKHKSAIINLSSFLGEKAIPFVTLYSATKAFNRQFSNSIAIEYPNIDVMCLKPMFVESPLSQQKKGLGIPDRRECAWDSLKELRRSTESYGYYSHRIMGFLARTFVPDSVYRFLVGISTKRVLKSIMPAIKLQ